MTAADTLLVQVEAVLAAAYGAHVGEGVSRASVSFVGVDRIDVLRFGPDPDGLVRYATVGISRRGMGTADVDLVAGPRAELVLTLRGGRDSVLRRLAVVAAAPAVDGLVLAPDGTVDLGEPLWDGARQTAVLIEPPVLPPVTAGDGLEPVQLLGVTPLLPAELAHRRVHGAAALREVWARRGVDPRDPDRPVPDLG